MCRSIWSKGTRPHCVCRAERSFYLSLRRNAGRSTSKKVNISAGTTTIITLASGPTAPPVKESHHEENNRPPDPVHHKTATAQGRAAEREPAYCKDQHHYAANGKHPPRNALPKIPTKGITNRETVISE